MKIELINPFIDAALGVFDTMAQTEAIPGKPFLRTDHRTQGVVTGVIGMAGESISGNMILSFDAPSILAIVNRMLMERYQEIGDDVLDAVGELTNMISGGAKKLIGEQGHQFSMARPIMVQGQGIELKQLMNAQVVSIPFSTPEGHFWIDASLEEVINKS